MQHLPTSKFLTSEKMKLRETPGALNVSDRVVSFFGLYMLLAQLIRCLFDKL